MRTPLPLSLLLALGSCHRPAPVPEVKMVTPSVLLPREILKPVPGATAVDSLEGEWRVAGIDGHSFDESVGLALRASDQQIWWEPRCAGMARKYAIRGQRIVFRSAEPPRPPGAPTPPVCAIGLPRRLGDVFQALDDATGVTRTPSNGIVIAGPRHSLTLYSQ